MAIQTVIRKGLNRVLRHANLRLDTLTLDKLELKRLSELEKSGYFSRPAFKIPEAFNSSRSREIINSLCDYHERFKSFENADSNDVGFTYWNDFFSSPDAEILYAIIRMFSPSTIIEVGSGNSTQVSRQAIKDARLGTKITCIDPNPRRDISKCADTIYSQKVEFLPIKIHDMLQANDILFIDSSHVLRPGNDVVKLFLNVLPELSSGVLVHVHDIFLPFDYCSEWIFKKDWDGTEQYLLYVALLNESFEILWPGYYLQKTLPEFDSLFPHRQSRLALSFWMIKR